MHFPPSTCLAILFVFTTPHYPSSSPLPRERWTVHPPSSLACLPLVLPHSLLSPLCFPTFYRSSSPPSPMPQITHSLPGVASLPTSLPPSLPPCSHSPGSARAPGVAGAQRGFQPRHQLRELGGSHAGLPIPQGQGQRGRRRGEGREWDDAGVRKVLGQRQWK